MSETLTDQIRVAAAKGCDVVVVVPVYKQPGFLPEALESFLAQQTDLRLVAVIVDDGCPFEETREIGEAYALANPGRIHYLRRRNGGLSAARNTGIAFALNLYPEVRAVYFLDADNRMRPHLIQRLWDAAAASGPEVGWIYPDIDMFGLEQNGSTRGAYSALQHLRENYCEAGSLVLRATLDAGVRFDETMRQGFEDWDFWLQAVTKGLRGRHAPNAGFRYRRRAESMLTSSERTREAILAGMRKKHAALFRPQNLVRLEYEDSPRFAAFAPMGEDAVWFVDPRAPSLTLSLRDCARRFAASLASPQAAFFPPFCLFAAFGAMEALARAGLDRTLLWRVQIQLRRATFVVVTLQPGPENQIEMRASDRPSADDFASAALIGATSEILAQVVADPSDDWIEATLAGDRDARVAGLRVRLPKSLCGRFEPPAFQAKDSVMRTVREFRRRRLASHVRGDWRGEWRRPRSRALDVASDGGPATAVSPLLRAASERHIGFVLPLFDFGGVEKVIANYARVFRTAGWRAHLFVTKHDGTACARDALAAFDSLNFLNLAGEEERWGAILSMGADVAEAGAARGVSDSVGALATMDVVLNTHALAAHGLMAALRGLGIQTYVGLHLIERSRHGESIGNPHFALPFEHVYDGFVVISARLADWCAARAIPREKIVLARNAASYAADPQAVAEALSARERREGALNVLFLGRLDMQKGLDRLARIKAKTSTPKFSWRIVGKSVLGDFAGGLLQGLTVEPPALEAAALNRLYAWADVVVLPSRFEGVPLTVLEAQRFGCVAVATKVGAVDEILDDERDGLLVDAGAEEDALVQRFVEILEQLANDRARLVAIGRAAAQRAAAASWETNLEPWLRRIREGEANRP